MEDIWEDSGGSGDEMEGSYIEEDDEEEKIDTSGVDLNPEMKLAPGNPKELRVQMNLLT